MLKSIAHHPRAPTPPQPKPAPTEPKRKPRKTAHALTHTVRPTRHALLCYHCDQEFDVLGHHRVTVCPRCHDRVDVVDYTIEDEFDRDLRTAGKVHVTAGGAVCGGCIKASSVRLDGPADAGSIETIRLEVCAQGRIGGGMAIRFRDVYIGPGAVLRFDDPMVCRTLTVAGCIRAHVEVEALAVIESGGDFNGRLSARDLRVDDGAGLRAMLAVGPPPDTEPT